MRIIKVVVSPDMLRNSRHDRQIMKMARAAGAGVSDTVAVQLPRGAERRSGFVDRCPFLRGYEKLYVLFQCLEHARQDFSSRSALWALLLHSPDPGRKLSREPQTLLSGQ
jgi:hypothetical protein